jgi:5-methylthioadenosine/S-adenosylhomocysteine deaminase
MAAPCVLAPHHRSHQIGGAIIVKRVLRLFADAVVTCDGAGTVFRPGIVDIDGARISWVGPAAGAPAHEGEERRLGGIVMPGLVNVHCHSPMTLFRGAAEDIPLDRFLREVLWPREARLTSEDVYWGMTLACAELLRAGVTTTCEMYVEEEALLAAVLEAGSRCTITPGVIDAPGWERLGGWRRRLADILAFCDRHQGTHDTVEVGIAAHSAYALPLEALVAISEAARERDALFHVHIAETRDECLALEQEHGMSVPELLADRGVFGGRVIAAHSVWLSESDLRIYREHDVAVAHCPQSNAKLAAGIAALAEMLALGLRVGLGTDGPSSNNDLDLWDELRLAPLLARIRTGDAAAVPATQALALATSGGAAALGLRDVGVLRPGGAADLIRLSFDDASVTPIVTDRDVVSHLVWAASSRLVTDVWVAGRAVVAAGACTTVDVPLARREVQERAARLAT